MALYSSQWGELAGIGPARESIENAFTFGPFHLAVVHGAAVIDASALDPGNTPNTTLRPGLLMGVISSTGKWTNYSPTATNGSQIAQGVLLTGLRMPDLFSGVTQDRYFAIQVGGPVQAARLHGLDLKARGDMFGRFIFDDDYSSLLTYRGGWRDVYRVTSSSVTVTPGDSGRIFETGSGAHTTFTLPTPSRGLYYRFFNSQNFNMTVSAAASGQLVTFNNAAATSIAYSTTGELIGGALEVVADAIGSKWHVYILAQELQTVTIT